METIACWTYSQMRPNSTNISFVGIELFSIQISYQGQTFTSDLALSKNESRVVIHFFLKLECKLGWNCLNLQLAIKCEHIFFGWRRNDDKVMLKWKTSPKLTCRHHLRTGLIFLFDYSGSYNKRSARQID